MRRRLGLFLTFVVSFSPSVAPQSISLALPDVENRPEMSRIVIVSPCAVGMGREELDELTERLCRAVGRQMTTVCPSGNLTDPLNSTISWQERLGDWAGRQAREQGGRFALVPEIDRVGSFVTISVRIFDAEEGKELGAAFFDCPDYDRTGSTDTLFARLTSWVDARIDAASPVGKYDAAARRTPEPIAPSHPQSILLRVEPSDAEVYVSGRLVGTGSVVVPVNSGGAYEVLVQRDGFPSKTIVVDVENGEQVRRRVRLRRRRMHAYLSSSYSVCLPYTLEHYGRFSSSGVSHQIGFRYLRHTYGVGLHTLFQARIIEFDPDDDPSNYSWNSGYNQPYVDYYSLAGMDLFYYYELLDFAKVLYLLPGCSLGHLNERHSIYPWYSSITDDEGHFYGSARLRVCVGWRLFYLFVEYSHHFGNRHRQVLDFGMQWYM